MTKLQIIVRALTCAAFVLVFTTFAQAQATRTWVSGVGDDVNPCSRTAPCKTFAGAISKTAEGGEIDALDPGGFGTLTITKALTVDGTNGQGFGSILAAGTTGVTVNITSGTFLTNAVVRLRNLSIQGVNQSTSPGLSGIRWVNSNGRALYVENCIIAGFNNNGIEVSRTAGGELYVRDTQIHSGTSGAFNAGATSDGIEVTSTAGFVFASISNVSVAGYATGIRAGTGARVEVNNSMLSRNTTGALATNTSELYLANSGVSHGVTGVQADAGGAIRLFSNRIYANSTGVLVNGTCQSDGRSQVLSNTTNVSGVCTVTGNV